MFIFKHLAYFFFAALISMMVTLVTFAMVEFSLNYNLDSHGFRQPIFFTVLALGYILMALADRKNQYAQEHEMTND